MSHKTEIVDYKKLANDQFAVLIRCCDDHLHWHTMHSSVVIDPQKMADSIGWARNLAAENHEASVRAEEKLKAMIGETVDHSNG